MLLTVTTDPPSSLFDWCEGFLNPGLTVVGGVREFPAPSRLPIPSIMWFLMYPPHGLGEAP